MKSATQTGSFFSTAKHVGAGTFLLGDVDFGWRRYLWHGVKLTKTPDAAETQTLARLAPAIGYSVRVVDGQAFWGTWTDVGPA